MRIELGVVVRDKVTGLVGVAENRATFLFGCDRYCVQPFAKEDGSVPKSYMVDEPQLEVVEGEARRMVPAGDPVQTIELGAEVEDPVRGQFGTATGRAVYLNGCSRIFVEAKQVGDSEPQHWWTDEGQLNVRKTLTGSVKRTIPPVESVRKITGGPARASSKY